MTIPQIQRRHFLELGFKGLAAIGAAPACARNASPASSYLARQIRFENRQKASCVEFVLNNGTTPDKPLIDSTLGGVALFDFDNDGFLDIFFTNGARIPTLEKDDPRFYNRLYKNNRDGTFTDVTDRAGLQGEGYCMGVAAADFDNDGWTDLYVTGVNHNALITTMETAHSLTSQNKPVYPALTVTEGNFGLSVQLGSTTTMTDYLIFLSQIIWIGL